MFPTCRACMGAKPRANFISSSTTGNPTIRLSALHIGSSSRNRSGLQRSTTLSRPEHSRRHVAPQQSSRRLSTTAQSSIPEQVDLGFIETSRIPSAADLVKTEAEAEGKEEDDQPREERRSPAAVFGSKRVGLEVIPGGMERGVMRELAEMNPREVREAFLSLLPPSASSSTSGSRTSKRGKSISEHRSGVDNGPALAMAKAATILPGSYAVMRNVMGELSGRLGRDWMKGAEGDGVVEVSGGYGPGIWALREQVENDELELDGPVQMKLVHSSRHGLDMATRLLSGPGMASESTTVAFDRKLIPAQLGQPSLVLSTFYLSTLPTASSRQTHLKHLLELDSPYLVLVDQATPTGWTAISEAREYIRSISTSEDPLHLVAPCPHEDTCPLLGGKDRCSFSQRVQRTGFMRKTKHASRGEEDVNYTYLIVGRGPRPVLQSGKSFSQVGRMGGVGREELEKAHLKREGKSELREVEGGEYEMVALADLPPDLPALPERSSGDGELDAELMQEAYKWPRVVAPPLKRSGHVILDTCFPDGTIQRLTYAKSHSKQVYHDARKSSWGDLFPHEPKSKLARTRGVRKLVKEDSGEQNLLLEENEELIEETGLDTTNWPVAELVSDSEVDRQSGRAAGAGSEAGPEVLTWKSGKIWKQGLGQTRDLSTLARRSDPSSVVQVGQRRYMSARPVETQHAPVGPRPKVTLNTLHSLASAGTPITCLTAFDYSTALVSETAGIDMVLVGDSLSQVAMGHSSTTAITLDEMIHHCKIVTRGAKSPFVFADMPFGTFEISVEDGVRNAIRMIKESGIEGVKIEGGREIVPLVKRLSEVGIPVIPHIGLQPQRAVSMSGYLVQGKTSHSAHDIYETARLMQEAGAQIILLEAIPHQLGSYITESLDLITIGIGAGGGTQAQVLVITDVLGTYAAPLPATGTGTATAGLGQGQGQTQSKPRFVRHFGRVGDEMRRAVEGYRDAVKQGSFPEGKESYGIKKEEWEGFLRLRAEGGGRGK